MTEKEFLQHFDDNNFKSAVSEGVTLVDFSADWCGPCKMLLPIIKQVAKDYDGKAAVGKVDTDASQQTAAAFNITSVPTLILFKNGEEVDRIVGLKDEEALHQLIDSAL